MFKSLSDWQGLTSWLADEAWVCLDTSTGPWLFTQIIMTIANIYRKQTNKHSITFLLDQCPTVESMCAHTPFLELERQIVVQTILQPLFTYLV